MAYTTTLLVARECGLSNYVVNEAVGTGDNSNKAFELDNANVLDTSYALYFFDSDNAKTTLTDTTHYSLDLATGKISLTASGVTALGTNALLASYSHLADTDPQITESMITSYFEGVDRLIDLKTGRHWQSAASYVEYFDGQRANFYPRSEGEFVYGYGSSGYGSGIGVGYSFGGNLQEYDNVVVRHKPLDSVQQVTFLSKDTTADSVQSYDDNTATYTDNTTSANNAGTGDFNVFASTSAAGDLLYIGNDSPFYDVGFLHSQLGVGSVSVTWQYWNGSSWATLDSTDGTSGFTADGNLTFDRPVSWQKTTVNGSSSLHFVRANLASGTYSTEPKLDQVYFANGTENVDVALSTVRWDDSGRLYFLNNKIPFGKKNIRIAYKAGVDQSSNTLFPVIKRLATFMTGLIIFAKITGGSFDFETGFQIGSKSVQIGEVYTNTREVTRQFEEVKKEIMAAVGKRHSLFAV